MIDATVIILTKNEEVHIGRLLTTVIPYFKRVCVVDSQSQDSTLEICAAHGAHVFVNPWPGNHALQVNWAIENIGIDTEWVFRLDADEVLPEKFLTKLSTYLGALPKLVGGVYLHRRHVFLGKKIWFGSIRPARILRIWRAGCGQCDDRLMDEKIVLCPGFASHDYQEIFWDWNLKGLSHWIEKHNDYSAREALEQVISKNRKLRFQHQIDEDIQEEDFRSRLYRFFPFGLRGFLFFCYRFFLCAGFLDGFRGFLWHFFQGLWYRQLVDAKILEMESAIKDDWKSFVELVKEKWGYTVVMISDD